MPPRFSETEYGKTLRRLVSLSRFGSKPGLDRIRKLLSALANPQHSFRSILVAGTNGKGSTTAMLAEILRASSKRTGSYFSPSVFSFRERMQVDGKWISEKDFCRSAERVLALLPSMRKDRPTFFEVMTAMALLHFREAGVQFAILEVGLGGRFDATNIVEPELCIITSIGLEHTEVLGKTTAEIAGEKAGILRPGVPLVCAVKDRAAQMEIKKMARQLYAPFHFVNERTARSIRLASPGSFQRANAACASKAGELLGVKKSAARRVLTSFVMPARWQKISSHPCVIIDCVHNPPSAKAIQEDLKRDFRAKKNSARVLLFTAMKEKDYAGVLARLAPHFDHIVLCRPPYARAAKMKDLSAAALQASESVISVSDPDKGLARAKTMAGKNGRILAGGSMYLLQYLFGEREFRITG